MQLKMGSARASRAVVGAPGLGHSFVFRISSLLNTLPPLHFNPPPFPHEQSFPPRTSARGNHHASLVNASSAEPHSAESAAPQPILDGYRADPAIRVFGDTYYIYPTSDKPEWMTTDFSVWSSKDLIDWKNEGVILDVAHDLKWANVKAWAPDCIERGGKYYFYFCANHDIGVAVSDSPLGPFKDALGRPLVENDKIRTFSIDPQAYIDDDGQSYLYFGNGIPVVWKLQDDMISFVGEPVEIEGLKDFCEAVWVFKRAGKYYFTWSIDDARSPDYRVGWGIADSPFGPVKPAEKDFIILQKNGPAIGTAHHGVLNVPGTDRWYVAYHRHAIPDGSGYQRQVCLARMEFNADGTIRPMDPMSPAFKPGDIGEPLTNGKGRADQVIEPKTHTLLPTTYV